MTGEPMLIQIFINQYKYILAAWGMEMINLSVNIHLHISIVSVHNNFTLILVLLYSSNI